jgi:hypothetical protein
MHMPLSEQRRALSLKIETAVWSFASIAAASSTGTSAKGFRSNARTTCSIELSSSAFHELAVAQLFH